MTIDSLKICSIQKEHMPSVIKLLQSISEYNPLNSDLKKIWDLFEVQTNVFAFVAINDKNVLGYGSIVISRNIRGGKIGFIEDVVISKKYRNLGIGKKIICTLEGAAHDHLCYKIVLQSTKNSTEFYQKLDFSRNSGLGMVKFMNFNN
jgi:N-acetylglutamate synthase-like GNAT family acetyltransferase|tara:strand:+ start:551 stop:994 length:444 start_codon:yes stop_codon:yes gene_type:complete